MALAPPAASVSASKEQEGLRQLLLPWDLRLTAEQFALVCQANPDAVLELSADGRLIPMTPTGGETGLRNSLLSARLQIWALGRADGWCSTARAVSGCRMAPS
jgi:Uma2 family endonuclease